MIINLPRRSSSSMDTGKNQVFVNYNSSSYGSLLIRSPNSPPSSPHHSPSHSIANLSHLFLSSSLHQYFRPSSARSLLPLPLPQAPPLLPLPASGRLLRQRGKRKAKNAVGRRKAITSKGECPAVESSVYLMSPPPSSLPLPKFSLMRPKAVGGGTGGVGAGSCIAAAAVGGGGGGADELLRVLPI